MIAKILKKLTEKTREVTTADARSSARIYFQKRSGSRLERDKSKLSKACILSPHEVQAYLLPNAVIYRMLM